MYSSTLVVTIGQWAPQTSRTPRSAPRNALGLSSFPRLAKGVLRGLLATHSLWVSVTSSTFSAQRLIDAQKNVYSVFKYNPASVGFAALSETAIAQNGVKAAVPSPTIGAVTAATNTGVVSNNVSGAVSNGPLSLLLCFWLASASIAFLFWWFCWYGHLT
jgi:hypothetical protein